MKGTSRAAGGKREAGLTPATEGGSSTSGEPHACGASRPKLSFKGSVTPEWARAHAPIGKGIGLSVDEVRHFRWSGQYLFRSSGNKHFTKAFGRDESSMSRRAALLQVLQWLWTVHGEETGEQCPWDFSEAASSGQ